MGEYLLISDAAKQVKVESHVLRYWEEELHLPIKRNELGHRYYTKEDVERFKEIKSMKERGLQLKAIKMILKDGRLDVLPEEREKEPVEARKEPAEVRTPHMAIEIVDKPVDKEMPVQPQERICTVPEKEGLQSESREEKAKRLQWILQQLIREAVRENNQDLCRELKESMVKELDYQFRSREEREEERDRRLEQRSEEYYQKMDELLRKKTRGQLRKQQKEERIYYGKDKATFINIQTRSRDHNDRVISLSNISVLCGRIIKCTGRKRGIRRLCRCITCSLFPCCRNRWNCNQKVNRSRRCIHKCRFLHSRRSDRPYMCRFLC